MNCERAESILTAYFDNELDPLAAAEFERHLPLCLECSKTLEELRSLRSYIGAAGLYRKAPEPLRRKMLNEPSSRRAMSTLSAQTRWRWFALAAALLLLAITVWRIQAFRYARDSQSLFVSSVVDAHLRSLQPGHLTDVLSSDQHTVKPWFAGKLDFAPPVRDFSDQGFPLQGGRLDVIQARTIASLVYGRHKHLVSVFISPTSESGATLRSGSTQGYQWILWRQDGMAFCAVSDISAPDLAQLQRLFSQP